jgi:hypothetical protein
MERNCQSGHSIRFGHAFRTPDMVFSNIFFPPFHLHVSDAYPLSMDRNGFGTLESAEEIILSCRVPREWVFLLPVVVRHVRP